MLHISWYQHVVTTFVECQRQALDRISELEMDKQQALEKEIASHKTLNNELAAACRRPMSDDGFSDHGQFAPGMVMSFALFLLSSSLKGLTWTDSKATLPLKNSNIRKFHTEYI